jgi:hypothetical protein
LMVRVDLLVTHAVSASFFTKTFFGGVFSLHITSFRS